jgi:hypothetical protein
MARNRTKLTYEKCSFSAVSDFEKCGEVAAGEDRLGELRSSLCVEVNQERCLFDSSKCVEGYLRAERETEVKVSRST